MNRIPGPRTPQSNVESGVEDDQEWLQHWSMGAWGGRKPKKKDGAFRRGTFLRWRVLDLKFALIT